MGYNFIYIKNSRVEWICSTLLIIGYTTSYSP